MVSLVGKLKAEITFSSNIRSNVGEFIIRREGESEVKSVR